MDKIDLVPSKNSFMEKMRFKKSTKNTFVYEGGVWISSLYIRKEGMPEEAPEDIEVEVKWK